MAAQVVVSGAVRDVAVIDAVDLGLHQFGGVPEPVRLFQVGGGVRSGRRR
jgi:class 3 adenylate cyclase